MAEKLKILVCDDEGDFLDLMRMRLEADGYDVIAVTDGAACLAKVEKDKPDLILLDVMMPKLNGFQVCRSLKQNPATQSIPVVMVTAKSQESDKFWAKETGADDYIVKPFDFDELAAKVGKFLQTGS